MFVPLNHLYHFLNQHIDDDVLIYRFWPHGSKNISDLGPLESTNLQQKSWTEWKKTVPMIMHDQEPLDFDLYQNHSVQDLINIQLNFVKVLRDYNLADYYLTEVSKTNLFLQIYTGINDKYLLCHSEVNSNELTKYQNNNAVGIYWWSHAMIARDWYRFAKLDARLDFSSTRFSKDFNIYNRAWCGTREYRLKFAEMIIGNNLENFSNIKFSPVDHGSHYTNHVFKNPSFVITNTLDGLPLNEHPAEASADYDAQDYQTHALDVVLETLFDDTRIHLTEKTLRPIACGKPFILVSTPGALEYLRRYGFKTFGSLINEEYDHIIDPVKRLQSIINTMDEISKIPTVQKMSLYNELHRIAEHNKKWFWSDEFSTNLIDEFSTNYQLAVDVCRKNQTGYHWQKMRVNFVKRNPKIGDYLQTSNKLRSRKDIVDLWLYIKSQRSTS